MDSITKYKAWLVAQGYLQKYGDDYDEVFAPVMKPITLLALLAIAGQKKMMVKHYDIESAYLMVICHMKFTWNNPKATKLIMNSLCANLWRTCMDSNKELTNGTRNLMTFYREMDTIEAPMILACTVYIHV